MTELTPNGINPEYHKLLKRAEAIRAEIHKLSDDGDGNHLEKRRMLCNELGLLNDKMQSMLQPWIAAVQGREANRASIRLVNQHHARESAI